MTAYDACGVALVSLSVDGLIVASRTRPPWTFDVPLPGSIACATAVDRAGNSATACDTVTWTGPTPDCQQWWECPPNHFCMKAVGDCNGTGTCEPIAEVCTTEWDPVCGCDGLTYGNLCEAWQEGMNAAFRGSCP